MKTISSKKPRQKQPASMAIGTRVELVDRIKKKWSFKKGLITDVSISTGNILYGVEVCAGFSSKDLIFISGPTAKTLAAAIKQVQEEGE